MYENRHKLHLTSNVIQHNTVPTILEGYIEDSKYTLLKLKIVRNETSLPFKKTKAHEMYNIPLHTFKKNSLIMASS